MGTLSREYAQVSFRGEVSRCLRGLWLDPFVGTPFPAVFGRSLTVTLLARRSRHFAGTRYKKRGLSAEGKVGRSIPL